MTKKGLIFDFDGTLADSMWVWIAIGEDFLSRRNLIPEPDFTERLAQLGLEAGSRDMVERYDLDEDHRAIMGEWLGYAREKYATQVWLKPHAEDFLRQQKAAGMKLAIATAQERVALLAALENEGVLDLFDAVLTCDEVCDTGKSTPAVYWEAQRCLGLEVGECIVFEDVVGPALQAKAGGFDVVGVFDESPAQDHDALQALSSRFINSYQELLDTDPQAIVA